jgi:Flp pilus assembly pilin Flp
MDLILKFSADEAGAPAVEYALLLAFIAVAIAGSVLTFGTAVRGLFDNAAVRFPGG